jgi:hypothetical protein
VGILTGWEIGEKKNDGIKAREDPLLPVGFFVFLCVAQRLGASVVSRF